MSIFTFAVRHEGAERCRDSPGTLQGSGQEALSNLGLNLNLPRRTSTVDPAVESRYQQLSDSVPSRPCRPGGGGRGNVRTTKGAPSNCKSDLSYEFKETVPRPLFLSRLRSHAHFLCSALLLVSLTGMTVVSHARRLTQRVCLFSLPYGQVVTGVVRIFSDGSILCSIPRQRESNPHHCPFSAPKEKH